MLIWPIYFILNLLVMVLCYITNPIVCLFCNEEGELPHIFRMWQTWDDSCNPRFFVMEKVNKFLRYDYDKHYEEYEAETPDLAEVGRTRWFARVKDGNFTIKERIQRYICRVLWLTRNCGYGFAFWCFGRTVDSKDLVYIKNEKDLRFYYDETENILFRTWAYQNEKHLFGNVYWNLYMGWKINDQPGIKQCMIAVRILAFSIK